MDDNFLDFKKRQIRSYFINLNKETKIKDANKIPITYVHLKLPVEKISTKFEEQIKNDIDHNYLDIYTRKAKMEDLKSILFIYNKAWKELTDPHGSMTTESLEKIFHFQDVAIILANIYGMDVGFIILDFEGAEREYGIIAGLGILPRFQRKGIGKALGMAAWRYFKEKGVIELRCEVFIENKHSYEFIKSLGFEEYKTSMYKLEDFELHYPKQ